MNTRKILIVALLACFAAPALAQEAAGASQAGNAAGAPERRPHLSPEQREKLRNMTPEERQKFQQEARERRWQNRPGPQGGPGASPDRRGMDRDNNPPGMRGGPGTNWENRPGPQGGPGASPNRRAR